MGDFVGNGSGERSGKNQSHGVSGKRGEGYCARLETRMEHCKVLGLFNIRVLASGTIFLGEMVEPVTDTKLLSLSWFLVIPFTGRPVALVYDYKVKTGGQCVYEPGFGHSEVRPESDMAETSVLLQYRWEDEEGNVYARRVATGWERFEKSEEEWQMDIVCLFITVILFRNRFISPIWLCYRGKEHIIPVIAKARWCLFRKWDGRSLEKRLPTLYCGCLRAMEGRISGIRKVVFG